MSPVVIETQALVGSWEGKLEIGAIRLRVVFYLKMQDGALTGTMDSPDQGAFGIPVTEVIRGKGKKITFKVQAATAVFEGELGSEQQIKGKWLQSNQTIPLVLVKLASPPDYSRPQDPKEPFPYQSVDVTFKNTRAGITLAGTLTYPNTGKPLTVVVLISGSGSQNRNEEVMGHRPFLVLADHLTRRGITVLRYDDRGVGGSGGDPAKATSADYATDVQAAVEFLKNQKFAAISKIGLIGHSEGGIIAPLAVESSLDVDFFILMAAPGCTGKEILLQQTEAIMKAMGTPEEEIIKAAKANTLIYDTLINTANIDAAKIKIREILVTIGLKDDQIDRQIAVLTSPWILFFLKYDPIPVLERMRIPVLAINGSLDLQVLPKENLSAIRQALQKAGNSRHTIKEFSGLNHLFQSAKTGLMDEYSKIPETIAPEVLDFITEWIDGLEK